MITLEHYFGKVSHIAQPSDEVKTNAIDLLSRVNNLLLEISEKAQIMAALDPVVNSGWRPATYNAGIPNAAPNSRHITGQAIDLADPDGELDDWLMRHSGALLNHGIWIEHPLATKGWSHWQSVPPRSGNLVFIP